MQFYFREFRGKEFFNSHRRLHSKSQRTHSPCLPPHATRSTSRAPHAQSAPNPHPRVTSSTPAPHVYHLINRVVSFHHLYLLSPQHLVFRLVHLSKLDRNVRNVPFCSCCIVGVRIPTRGDITGCECSGLIP